MQRKAAAGLNNNTNDKEFLGVDVGFNQGFQ